MTIDSVPDLARHAVSPKDATKLPGAPKDERTIIKRLKMPNSDPRSLHGYASFDGETATVPRYRVYVDQFQPSQTRRRPTRTSRRYTRDEDVAALQARIEQAETIAANLRTDAADLEARLTASQESNEQLRSKLAYTEAELARDREVIRVLSAANALTADAAETIQESGEAYKMAAEKALAGAGKYLKVTQMTQGLLAQYFTPDDLSDLPTT